MLSMRDVTVKPPPMLMAEASTAVAAKPCAVTQHGTRSAQVWQPSEQMILSMHNGAVKPTPMLMFRASKAVSARPCAAIKHERRSAQL